MKVAVKYRSGAMKKLVEEYCRSCAYFLAEEISGWSCMGDPEAFDAPKHLIVQLEEGSKPYEFRICDARYEPDERGGCKHYTTEEEFGERLKTLKTGK